MQGFKVHTATPPCLICIILSVMTVTGDQMVMGELYPISKVQMRTQDISLISLRYSQSTKVKCPDTANLVRL